MPATLPYTPFGPDDWSGVHAEAAKAFWDWHEGLVAAGREHPNAPASWFEGEADKAQAKAPMDLLPDHISGPAYRWCDDVGAPHTLLGHQVMAVHQRTQPVRFETRADLNAFLQQWAVPHGRLLAHIADAAHTWQVGYVDEISQAFFLLSRLVHLPSDIRQDQWFIPQEALEKNDVQAAQLREGRLDDGLRKLLWRQTVRVQDGLAQGQELVHELPRGMARTFKRYWLGALEVVRMVEKRRYDVWSEPIVLSSWQEVQVRFQARFGKATFRKR